MSRLGGYLLGRLGLTTHEELSRETARKDRWHSLVRDVFARYYLKLREPFYAVLPPLPHRYSRDWERQMKASLDRFLALDLQPVAELLEVCGFGSEKWDRLSDIGFARLEELIERLLSVDGGPPADGGGPAVDGPEVRQALEEARNEIRKLRIGGRRALEQIKEYERQLERLVQDGAARGPGGDGGEPDGDGAEADGGGPEVLFDEQREGARLAELEQQVRARDEEITALNRRLSEAESTAAGPDGSPSPSAALEGHVLQGRVEELERELRAREEMVSQLQARIEQLQGELEASPASTEDSLLVDDDLARQNAQLRGESRAKDQTIDALRRQVDELEKAMDSTRGQLMDQVRKLGDMASGEIDLKPSEELETMSADELLSYAQEVAGDLDVRKQALDEGIQGVEAVRQNYDESRRFYDVQQRKFQAQLEEMSAELQTYQQQAIPDSGGTDENSGQLIAAQRHQLQLLGARITELSNTNRNLGLANGKMYKDLEAAVKKLIPLRRQIEELESLREALCGYIREKHDRTFTVRRLAQK